MRIQGDNIYLKMLERKDCKTLWNDYEYDFKNPTEEFNIGHSDIVIGDIALQDIDRINRNCSIGIGIAKIVNRSKGYGGEAVRLMLDYGFTYLGMERIYANTLDINTGAQRMLEKNGLCLEGIERKVKYLNGEMHDRLHYAILKEDYYKLLCNRQ